MSSYANYDATSLQKAVMAKDWPSLAHMYSKDDKSTHTAKFEVPGHEKPATALHYAILGGMEDDLIRRMLEAIKGKEYVLEIVDEDNDTPLHLAARSGFLENCKCMAEAVPPWLFASNNERKSPLFVAGYSGKTEVFLHLNYAVHAPDGDLSDKMLVDLKKMKHRHFWGILVTRKMVLELSKWSLKSSAACVKDEKIKWSYELPALNAAGKGVEEVLTAIMRESPKYITSFADKDKKNILHLAVQNRRQEIVDMLKESKRIYPALLNSHDAKKNTVLHLAATPGGRPFLTRRSLYDHFRQEVKWFKFIERLAPSEFRYEVNDQGKTPYDILEEKHKDLLNNSVQLLSNASSVVASVIAAAAFNTASDAIS